MQTDFKRSEIIPVRHGKTVALLGSCFSENMADHFRFSGLDVVSNPWGTIFHPVPLLNVLTGNVDEGAFLQRDDIWLSYQASGLLYGFSESELKEKLEQAQLSFLDRLENSSILIITPGTAHGYVHAGSQKIVANCHKGSSGTFQKLLTGIPVLAETLTDVVHLLNERYPHLQVVLTLSPVRYQRDGWVENQHSKARLLEAIHQTVERTSAVYFPAYEYVIDVLRDYRWFENDGVHPNPDAVKKVFELFSQWFFTEDTLEIIEEAEGIRRLEKHRVLYPGSRESERFLQSVKEKRESFLSRNPNFIW